MEHIRPDGTKSAGVIAVIKTTAKRGLGTIEDPVRIIDQYWDLNGNLLAENDVEHCAPIISHEAKAIERSIKSISSE